MRREDDKEFTRMDQKNRVKRTENILTATVLKIFIAIGFFAVFGLLRSYSVEVCLQTLGQETQEAKNDLYRQITSLQEQLEILADMIGEEGLADHVQAAKILRACEGMDIISRAGILLPDDQILQQDGTLAMPRNGITFDALAEKGSFITNVEQDNLDPDASVLFCNVPVVTEGRAEGVLFGVIELKDIADHMEVDIFDGNADIFIVDTKNMDLIMDTLHSGTETPDALHGRQIKKGYSEEQLIQNLTAGRGGLTAYFSKSVGGYLYTSYEPVGINEWFIMLSVPEDIVLKEASYMKKVLFCLGIYEGILLLLYIWWEIIRTRKEIQEKEKIAITDLLTGLKNRNAYEQVLDRYTKERPDLLSCVYADANGLHELNNSQGHLAGDKMLQSVADALVDAFGGEDVYRIGGDEFLVFTGTDEDTAVQRAAGAKEEVSKAGYHVSVGTASGEKTATVTAIVKAAEQKMYEDKRRYYMSHGERRKMRH